MTNQIPKAVKVENTANILKVEFDNGDTKYLRSGWSKEITDALSPSKGKGKRSSLLLLGRNMWMGTKVVIEEDGTVILNDKEKYSSEELWQNGKNHVHEL